MTYHNWYGPRRAILRTFGARITSRTKVRRTLRIDRPWNLAAGSLTVIGDHVAIRAREPVHLGDRCVVSQYAILTTEERDPSVAGCPTRTGPIEIEDDCWVATDALVRPGTIIRQGTVVGARSVASGELPPWMMATGDPAVARAPRRLREASDSA
jgi:putative colanic acid biosynthesis acetyltransferase WcaF